MEPVLVISHRPTIRYYATRILGRLRLPSTTVGSLQRSDAGRWAAAPLILIDAGGPDVLHRALDMPCRDHDTQLAQTEDVIVMFGPEHEQNTAFSTAHRLGAVYTVPMPGGQEWLAQHLAWRRESLAQPKK